VIGRGAMGMIYQAHDPVIDREVAIKLIRADLLSGEDHEDYLARFQREAQAAGRCAHPNIVAIYDFAVHEGNPFLAMEYVEGNNLSQVLARSGRFAPAAAIGVIGQVLDALACAHGLGIVHRDVKPANILLVGDGRVKMTDFGISRLDNSALTQTGSVIGTPSYMSPEQCRGDVVDARSDLFSTGVVLYEMLSGERPFTGRGLTEVAFKVINNAPPDLATKCPELPATLVAAVHRALAKQPGDRFASASEMAAALRESPAPAQHTDDRTVVLRHTAPTDITDASLATIERELAHKVGPIAHHLVQSAARRAGSMGELREMLAQRLDQPELRSKVRAEPTLGSGGTGTGIAPAIAQQAERELTRRIGPIARVLVKRALQTAQTPDELWDVLATHIERDADRQAFLLARTR
jgi:serine/threonine-protein kinase